MPGTPTNAELVEAVEVFLRGVEAKLSGREAFHAKVAANVLAIVARDLRQDPDAVEAAVLGDVAVLCARLRSGATGPDTPGLLDSLTDATVARLEVDNPRYSTLARLKGSAA
jgi:hypothetical protein